MKKILVATDFSKDAYCALFYAAQLYKHQACTFYILNSFYKTSPAKVNLVSFSGAHHTEADLFLQSKNACQTVKHDINWDTEELDHSFETLASHLPLPEAINHFVMEKNIDLVVMGTKGKNNSAISLFGSNTIQVIKRLTDCPVLVVPKQIDFIKLKRIGFATDFKSSIPSYMLSEILALSVQHKASIKIIHLGDYDTLNPKQAKHLEALKSHLSSVKNRFHWLPNSGKKSKIIENFVNENDFDMLMMVYNPHDFLESMFREAVVEHIGQEISMPYLVLPNA